MQLPLMINGTPLHCGCLSRLFETTLASFNGCVKVCIEGGHFQHLCTLSAVSHNVSKHMPIWTFSLFSYVELLSKVCLHLSVTLYIQDTILTSCQFQYHRIVDSFTWTYVYYKGAVHQSAPSSVHNETVLMPILVQQPSFHCLQYNFVLKLT